MTILQREILHEKMRKSYLKFFEIYNDCEETLGKLVIFGKSRPVLVVLFLTDKSTN